MSRLRSGLGLSAVVALGAGDRPASCTLGVTPTNRDQATVGTPAETRRNCREYRQMKGHLL